LEEIFTPGKEVQDFIQLSEHADCRFHELPRVPDGEDHSSHQREEVHFAAALSPHGFMEAIPDLVKKRFLEANLRVDTQGQSDSIRSLGIERWLK